MSPRWTIALLALTLFVMPSYAFAQDESEPAPTAIEAAISGVSSAVGEAEALDVPVEESEVEPEPAVVDTFKPTIGKQNQPTTLEATQPPKEARLTPEAEDAKREAMDVSLAGKPIGRVLFECDLPLCQNPANARQFARLTGLAVGENYASERMRIALERLAKTGFFSKLEVRKELIDQSVFITIIGTGATLIREVTFTGLDTPPFESDLRKVLVYRQGQAYRGDKTKAQTQLQSFKNIYQRDGYFGTTIELFARPVEGSKHLVDLEFRIKKGKARQICDVGLKGVKAMPYVEAREWLLSDGSFFSQRLNLYDTTFTTKGFKTGQQELVQEYRRRGFFQARVASKAVQFDKNSNCVTLLVEMLEGPHWDLKFTGVERFVDQDLIEELPFFESGYVDREEIRRAEAAIRKLYETRGYPFAEVSAQEIRRDDLDRVLEFNVKEGPELEIREIKFHGNKTIDSDTFLEVMGTRVFALFDVGGYLQTDQLLGDFSRIEGLYREKGYNKALVERFALEQLDDGLRVHVFIDEGAPTLVERVDVDGNRKLPDGTLLEGLNTTTSKPFYPLNLKSDQGKLIGKYSELGHPLARVRSSCFLPTGEQVACEAPRMPRTCVARVVEELEGRCRWAVGANKTYMCTRVAVADPSCQFQGGVNANSMRVRHEVDEGPLVRTGPRLLKGNFETQNHVIHREIPLRRGDLLDTQEVITAQGNLRQLNVFDSVSIETIGLDDAAEGTLETEAALLINVEEARTSFLDFRFGFELREPFADSSQFLLTGEAQYTNRNLLGSAQGIQPRVVSAVDIFQLIELADSGAGGVDPSRIDSADFLLGAELLYSHPRFLKDLTGIERLYFTLGPFYLLDLLGVVDRQILREEWGVRADFRKDLSELLNRLFFKLGIEFKQVATFQEDGAVIDNKRIFSPRQTRGKLEPDLAYDQRDSPLNPTKGYLLRAQPALVSGDAFGQGGENFFGDSFLRLDTAASLFVPFWKGIVVFAQSVRYGQVFPIVGRETPVPVDERFFLGGVRSVRGFDEDSLGPINENQVPTGGEFYMAYNAELRYPILAQFSIYGATFFDAGLLADCFPGDTTNRSCTDSIGDSLQSSLRASAGLGLRALIFDQLPIVLDYGIVLNRRPGEKYGQFHLNVGYTFD